MYNFNFELDDFQKEAVNHITEGKSVVVCAPTGAGKTCIAEFAIHKALEAGKRIFYTTPLKALSNQKYFDFCKTYGNENVGLLTGDTSINRKAQIVVMTTEVFRNMLYGTTFGAVKDNIEGVKYVVLDEVHYMNDESRGTVWEESIIYCPTNIQLIALSATVANSHQLTDWINTVHSKTECVYTDFRPVPLRFFYYDSSNPREVLPLLTPEGKLNKKIKPEKKFKHFSKTPVKSPVSNIIDILHKKDMLPAIYFTFSRRKCDEQMEKCSKLDLLNKEEKNELSKIIDEYIAENPYLYANKHLEYLNCGVASHHAGLLPGWKVLVEKLFQKGLIKAVFATETLAAGINMPARTTVISSISKRTDSGHRILTPSEFLQMSGRAGRRGMDEIGYVVVVGTPFQTPEEVAELATSKANPLESRFSPSYSMVLNLLQRFSLDEAKELIFKSFGYFSSKSRLKPLISEKLEFDYKIEDMESFKCHKGLSNNDLLQFVKTKDSFVEMRRLVKILRRQAKQKGRYNTEEVREYDLKSKDLYKKMSLYACEGCKLYKRHMKEIQLLERFKKRTSELEREIEWQKDIYWQNFLSHRAVLTELGHLKDDFPSDKGKTTMALRTENELYLSEIILNGYLEMLSPAELAGVICAIITEEIRNAETFPANPSPTVKKTLNKIKDLRKKLHNIQRDNKIEAPMYINPYFSSVIEAWVNGAQWQGLFEGLDVSEGDVVRTFKRTIDVLRQLSIVDNVSSQLSETAKEAIKAINREPVDVD